MPPKRLTKQYLDSAKPLALQPRLSVMDEGGHGLEFRVTQGGSKSWAFRYRMPGRQPQRITLGPYSPRDGEPGLTLAEARAKATELRSKVLAGEDPAAAPVVVESYTFAKVAALFIESRKAKGNRTVGENERMLSVYLTDEFNSTPIEAIRSQQVRDALEPLAKKAPAQAEAVRVMLRTIFNFAIRRELRADNPAARVDRLWKPVARKRALSRAELGSLWNQIDTLAVTEDVREAIRLLVLTGARTSEVLEAGVGEFDFGQQGVVWTIPAERAKGKRDTVLPISEAAADIVRRSIKRHEDRKSSFLFPTHLTNGKDAPITQGVARKAIYRALDAGTLTYAATEQNGRVTTKPIARFGPHDLRRTMGTRLAEDHGVDVSLIQKMLSHREIGVTAIHYVHSHRLAELRKVAELWADHVKLLAAQQSDGSNVVSIKATA